MSKRMSKHMSMHMSKHMSQHSVCLFHHSYGGTIIHQSELERFNIGKKHLSGAEKKNWRGPYRSSSSSSSSSSLKMYNESMIGDFVDVVDEHVYAAALDRFEAALVSALTDTGQLSLLADLKGTINRN